jgi:hypothetical protein
MLPWNQLLRLLLLHLLRHKLCLLVCDALVDAVPLEVEAVERIAVVIPRLGPLGFNRARISNWLIRIRTSRSRLRHWLAIGPEDRFPIGPEHDYGTGHRKH